MEKKFVGFLVISAAILFGSQLVSMWLVPRDVDVAQNEEGAADQDLEADGAAGEQAAPDAKGDAAPPENETGAEVGSADELNAGVANGGDAQQAPPVANPARVLTLGSLNSESPYKLIAWLNTRGAALECVAMNDSKIRDLEDKTGYLGYLALTDTPRGPQINAVGDGTPAALATSSSPDATVGLKAGDTVLQVWDRQIRNRDEVRLALKETHPGQTVEIKVLREDQEKTFTAKLGSRPMEVIRPEPQVASPENPTHPLSYLLTLQFGQRSSSAQPFDGIHRLTDEHWEARELKDGDEPGVEFRYLLKAGSVPAYDLKSDLLIIKRFRLARAADGASEEQKQRLYHLTFELEFINQGTEPVTLSYALDGPTGLPLEGWWYAYKIHPTSFSGAGVRDIVGKKFGGKFEMITNSKIVKQWERHEKDTEGEEQPFELVFQDAPIQYAGVDAKYFASAIVANADETDETAIQRYMFDQVRASPVAGEDPLKKNRTDVSFRLISPSKVIPPDGSYRQSFLIFAGPKQRDILAQYGLDGCLTYGWFPWVAKPLTAILHAFYAVVRNYGVAIILLTILVRGCLFPLGRHMAMNAQKMQELAPEMKRIAEKYKNDMEARAAAQRELFRKNNYNPLSGCLPMAFQLPIFIGLYRALSVDIELRQAPLIPGIEWCSNLAGPDQFWYWENFMPTIIASPSAGWLGPYLNVLPLVSVAFMMVHQKLFTPPATDEQQEMQQKVMKFMMLFMGFLFFRVPAGLCLYFITSSVWGLAERKLLPKPKNKGKEGESEQKKPGLLARFSKGKNDGTNGAAEVAEKRRQRQKRR